MESSTQIPKEQLIANEASGTIPEEQRELYQETIAALMAEQDESLTPDQIEMFGATPDAVTETILSVSLDGAQVSSVEGENPADIVAELLELRADAVAKRFFTAKLESMDPNNPREFLKILRNIAELDIEQRNRFFERLAETGYVLENPSYADGRSIREIKAQIDSAEEWTQFVVTEMSLNRDGDVQSVLDLHDFEEGYERFYG